MSEQQQEYQVARRVFRYKKEEIVDPDPSRPPEEALKMLLPAYPEFANASTPAVPEFSDDGQIAYFDIQVAMGKHG